ncbi:MAG TPA: hopanoid-associated sugar epimerase [Terriglobia bacterium]|nr:hopanoid-associated sugar epimerase [Terriglobia bacterium]
MISLVTGASGFVGSHVARLLAAQGGEVRVLTRASSDLRAIEGIPVERVSGDLRDPASLKSAVNGVTCVFHVAADYRLWSKNPQEIYASNVEGTRDLLRSAREARVARFVYTSTVGTIAVPVASGLPDETTEARLDQMIGHYKRSKFLAEQEALRAAREGMPVVIVNPTTPVGPGDWKPTPTGQLIVDFLNGKTPAYVDTGLNIVRVEDVAKGHLLAAERGRVGERYLLGAENMTLLEIFATLAKFSGRPAPRWKIPYSLALAAGYGDAAISAITGRMPRIPLEGVRMARHKMFADCSKAARDLGFQPGPAAEALRRAAKWYAENGYIHAK